MFGFLIVVISLLAVLLCVIILIQSGKGGGLAASFGGASSSTDSFMGGRQAATALTKMTWVGGGIFLFLSLVLAVLSSQTPDTPESILRGTQTGVEEVPPTLLEAPPVLEGEGAGAAESGDTSGGGAQEGTGDPPPGDVPDGP